MQSAMRSRVPSRSLLRFLRTQSETAFFSPSHLGDEARAVAPTCNRTRLYNTDTQSCTTAADAASRPTQAPAQAVTLEANLWPFGRPRQEQLQSPNCGRAFGSTAGLCGWYKSASKPRGEDPASSWQKRLWGMPARRGIKPLKPDDLPGHDEFEHGSMFNSRRIMTAKAAAEPRLRCTEVDENGQVILVDGEFKKSELIAKVSHYTRKMEFL